MKMIIIRKNGNILSIQQDNFEIEKSLERMTTFNETHIDMQAEFYEFNEIEAYLYKKNKLKISDFKQDLQDIYYAIQNLDTNLDWLENICKEDEH